MRLNQLSQERLALIVCSNADGAPLRKIPVYSEILLSEVAAEVAPIESENFINLRERNPELAAVAQQEMQRQIDEAWLEQHGEQFLSGLLDDLEQRGFAISRRGDGRLLDEVASAVQRLVQRHDVPPPVPKTSAPFDGRRVPLGLLATDHAGYLSYDLTRLNWKAILPEHQWGSCALEFRAYPMLLELNRVAVLVQRRYADDAIFAKVELPFEDGDPAAELALNLPAMQNPGLIDWRLSPGSFAAVPQQLIGADGCEALTPANFAVSEFHMRQVVRLNERFGSSTYPKAHVYEYSVSLTPIGHSLGEVKYALPLAPGETVRLAVIDWRRTDTAARTESTVVTESLLHDQTHDRMITETVRGALDEWQRGGSVMGGLAGGGGASGQIGIVSVVGGGMHSLGGAYATSSGSRDVAVDTTQKITEAIHQSSVGQRELNSTVVVQSDQVERQNVETRAFANHNRGHTLTVLYYEVLRHFRVETRYSRRYDALLLHRENIDLRNDIFLMANRHILAPALLNPGLAVAFDALERNDRVRKERIRNPPIVVPPFDEANIVFTSIQIESRIGNDSTDDDIIFFMMVKGQPVTLPFSNGSNANFAGEFNKDDGHNIHLMSGTVNIRWGDIEKILFKKLGSDKVGLVYLAIIGHFPGHTRTLFSHVPGANYVIEGDLATLELTPIQTPPPPAPPQPALSFEQALSLDDYALSERLKDHLVEHADHYSRIVDLSRNSNSWVRRLEDEIWESQPVSKRAIDIVAPTPLEVLGSRVAFPLLDQSRVEPQNIAPVERLISLPTRGIFAEAKLGHCNVAEEIDETRFWRWDEHPLPFVAANIADIETIQPKPQSQNLSSTPLPAPVATIQATPALPDPSGMAAALKALTAPDVFRDMSAKAEVQKLLSDLIEGAVDMAQAANRAREIKSKLDTDLDKQSRQQAIAALESNNAVRREEIQAQREKSQQLSPSEAQHASKLLDNQHAQGKITTEERNERTSTLMGKVTGASPSSTSASKPPAITKAENIPAKGLVFGINFQNVGDRAGRPVSGFATVTVISDVTGKWQPVRREIFGSSIQFTTDIAESGTVQVSVTYRWNTFEDVVADAIDKGLTGLKVIDYERQFSGSGQYTAPEKGNLVQMTVKPATLPIKKKATSGKAAATNVQANGQAQLGVVGVGLSAGESETFTEGAEREWTVEVLTGGLEVQMMKHP
jgi:hypothetical protein